MKRAVLLLLFTLVARCVLAQMAAPGVDDGLASPSTAIRLPVLSPRLLALQTELLSGESTALRRFWEEMGGRGTPLVEPIPGDDGNSWVTFLWQAQGETRNVAVFLGTVDQMANPHYFSEALMANLPGTDVWYRTYRYRNDARYSYSLSPNDALTLTSALKPEERAARMATLQPDPLNPKRYLNRSVVELPHAPAQPWVQPVPGTPTGKVEEHKFKSAILNNERSIWIYTPTGYSTSDTANSMVVMFDGDGEFNAIAPVILDNLLAQRRLPPVVMVMIGNAAGARIRELWHNDGFNEFLAKEVMPWVGKNYRVSGDPRRVVVAGRSLGGNAAVYAGLRLPHIFGNVISQSGGMMYRHTRSEVLTPANPGQFFEEGFPASEWLAKQVVTQKKENVSFYLEAGLAEDIAWQEPVPRFAYPSLLLATRHLRDVLQAKGYTVHYNEYNGGHEALSWRGTFGGALIALLGKVPTGDGRARANSTQVERWYREYMAAVNAHDVEGAMARVADDALYRWLGEPLKFSSEDLRHVREWEIPMKARFEYEIVRVQGDCIFARHVESNLLKDALNVRRQVLFEHCFRDGKIISNNMIEVRDLGEDFPRSLAKLVKWLGSKPEGEKAGLLRDGQLLFNREAGRKLVPLLAEYRQQTGAAGGRRDHALPAANEVAQSFIGYMAALNAHNVDKVMSYYAPEMVRRRAGQQISYVPADMRAIREWEAPMRARFDFEIVSVRGEWLTARLQETNAIYDAFDVKRPMVSEYRWRYGKIVEMNLKEIREAGRDWNEARAEFEKWLAAKPATETAGALHEGRMLFTGEAAKKQLSLVAEYRKLTQAARAQNEKVMQGYITALNRHDVDGQYAHYSPDLYFIDDGQKVKPEKEGSRANREFEAVNNAKWSYTVLGAGLDSLEMIITEAMDFYDLLGVGPRSHRARYRFRDGKIVQGQAWEWTQAGRPYDGARDRFTAWALKERPQQAARVTENGRLRFGKEAAAEINALVKEWYAAQPCRIYHPSFNAAGTQIVFSSDCEGPWGIYVALADGTLPRRLTPRDMEARLPNWSPDGAKLVFQSNKEGNWEIYTVNADGTGLQRMTEHPRGDSSGAFSPDGTQILFASDRRGMNELYLMPAAGGEAKVLGGTRGAGFRNVWAPDGSHVLFRASTPPSEQMSDLGEFFRVRPDGTPLGAVSGGKRREYNAVYSPDGARIAFDAHENGVTWESGTEWDIWLMNADGSGRKNLTAGNQKNDWGPAWSPDGRSIMFLSGTNNIYDIWLMNADGTNARRVTTWTGK